VFDKENGIVMKTREQSVKKPSEKLILNFGETYLHLSGVFANRVFSYFTKCLLGISGDIDALGLLPNDSRLRNAVCGTLV
jgi:hypothetical protein